MASSSSSPSSRRYDVFPSFSGVDVRKTFLSHLIEALDRRSINTFMDHGIVRSCIIADELISAIREARISIVIFSENYASSTWCLNELVEIHKCHKDKDLDQMVIPVFYGVDPSHVRKQIGGFGDVFKKTCEDKPEDQKQRWVKALTDISNLAGEDLRNGPSEASMVVKIANDVSNKLFPLPKGFGDLVGIEDHIEAIKLKLCLESKEARIMVGIWGQSGIGKSTIGRALYSQLSIQFHHRAFVTYKSTSGSDVSGMKLSWEKELLSEILGQKDIKIEHFGVVEQRLKHKKVLILLDDVDNLEFLKTLVGKAEWFGSGSRIIVITQDRQLLKAHEIDLVYEVKLPSQDLGLQMISQYAFGKDSPPDDFKALAFEVAELAGSLPLGLSVLGSSLKGRDKDEWVKMMPRLRNDSDDKIEETLRVGYDRLNKKNRELFKCIACFFNGFKVSNVKELREDDGGITMLSEKSLIRITPDGHIEMHNLLEKLGREIDRAKSKGNLGKRQFLTNFEDIQEVLTEKTGTETLLGIRLPPTVLFSTRPLLVIDEESFKGMRNLQYLEFGHWSNIDLPQGLVYLPLKLRFLKWYKCPLKSLPSTFKAEYLVNLIMKYSKLEKLWEGTLSLGSLKKMILCGSKYLKEIPDLSLAINLEELDLFGCESLVTLPSSIQNAIKLRNLHCSGMLLIDLKSLEGMRNLEYLSVDWSSWEGTQGIVYFPRKLKWLWWNNCPLRRLPSNFKAEYLVELRMENSDLEKLWDGTQPLGSLKEMHLRGSKYLKEIPDLSLAINLERLYLAECESLVTLPSSIQNVIKLIILDVRYCKKLESFPTDLNLESLKYLDLTGCLNLRNFPAIKMGCSDLLQDRNEIEVETWHLPAGLDYFDCATRYYFGFPNCFKLERDARELILRSCFKPVALPGGEIPNYFTYRTYGDSLTVTVPQSSLSQEFLRFKACVVVEPLTEGESWDLYLKVNVGFNGKQYQKSFFEDAELQICKTDHLFLCSFKFESEMLVNDAEFKFCCSNRIKECGVRLMYVYQETEYNQQTTRSKKRMRMTSGTSEEYINLAGDQVVADTGLAALNMELPLGQGEASSSTSLEGEDLCVDDYMITEEQDEDIPFLDPVFDDVELSERINVSESHTLAYSGKTSLAWFCFVKTYSIFNKDIEFGSVPIPLNSENKKNVLEIFYIASHSSSATFSYPLIQ